MSRLTFHRRVTLLGTAAVAVAILLALGTAFLVVRAELRKQVDDSLRRTAERLDGDVLFTRMLSPEPGRVLMLREQLAAPGEALRREQPSYVQVVYADGEVVAPATGRERLPGDERARELAASGTGSELSDAEVGGEPVRVLTRAVAPGMAVQVARNVEQESDAVTRLAWILSAVGLGGIGVAAGLGLALTRTATRPVRELSEAAEHVARTRDLSRRIDASGGDELGRLAESFNTMLGALDRSMRSQRQLVADASHELRTPLTSLRTNIEVLAGANGMAAGERDRILRDLSDQLEELTGLVGDVVDLAREGRQDEPVEAVRLDELVAAAVERARRLHPGLAVEASLEACVVEGARRPLDRAVANLLDNAAKWSPRDAAVDVTLRGGSLEVRDRGPGFSDEDLPRVFDRFYRSAAARGRPGSGLGLAIVRAVAESHGGSVCAENAAGGGARLRLTLPSANS
jgi:two-component system, OmpR family, sensor histidine kinase MprB